MAYSIRVDKRVGGR